jgi:uncharacterized MAPEG superfamily protein
MHFQPVTLQTTVIRELATSQRSASPRRFLPQRINPGAPSMSPTLLALLGFLSWTLMLLVLMEVIRAKLVLTREVPANGFTPDNAGLSPFMQRLARAHANCLEGLPLIGGFMLLAVVAGKSQVTDPLAYWLLGARVAQSLIHLASTAPFAVSARFTAFTVQMGIAIYWAVMLHVA